MSEYDTEFGLPGAALFSTPGVPPADLGENGDRAQSVNGTDYKKINGAWTPMSSGSSKWNVVYVPSGSDPYVAAANDFVLSDGVVVQLPTLAVGDQVGVMGFTNNGLVLDTANDKAFDLTPHSGTGFASAVFILTPPLFGATDPFWHPIIEGPGSVQMDGDVLGTSDSNVIVALQTVPIDPTGAVDGDVLGFTGGSIRPVSAVVEAVVAGTNIAVDDTDPHNPIVSTSSGISVTVNSGPLVASGELPLATTKQPVTPSTGIPQPLPPMFGFSFLGTPLILPVATTPATGSLQGICVGRDQNVWSPDSTNLVVWKVSPLGAVLGSFALPGAVTPNDICSGPDGNVWITDLGAALLFRVTPSGTVTPITIPHAVRHICAGPDGNVWAASDGFAGHSSVLQIAPDGTVLNDFILAGTGTPYDICVGPDGKLWLTDTTSNAIIRLATDGTFTTFPVTGSGATTCDYIRCGPDGNIWAVDQAGGGVLRVTPQGSMTFFAIPQRGQLGHLSTGAGGDIWVADTGGALWKVTPEGQTAEFVLNGYGLNWICSGPDGGLWLTSTVGVGNPEKMVDFPFTMIASSLETTGPLRVAGKDIVAPAPVNRVEYASGGTGSGPWLQYFTDGQPQNFVFRAGNIADGAAVVKLVNADQDGVLGSDLILIEEPGDYDFLMRFDLQPAFGADHLGVTPQTQVGVGWIAAGDPFLHNFSMPDSSDWQSWPFMRLRIRPGCLLSMSCVLAHNTAPEQVGDGSLDIQRTAPWTPNPNVVPAWVLGGVAPTLPFTVVPGANDELVLTPASTGTPETFTMAGGTYTTPADLLAAVLAAVGQTAEPLSTYLQGSIVGNNGYLWLGAQASGTAHNGDTITAGTHDVTAGLGFTGNPDTFAWGF